MIPSTFNLQPDAPWRVLRHPAAPGPFNMAVDEAIAQAVAAGLVPPTLRFYAWDPPCVSLGRNQPVNGVDLARIAAHGYGIVRRPTGGRAILHTDEMTYSMIASPEHPLMAGYVLDSYLRISHGLVAGLRRMGIEAEEAPGTNRAGPDVSAACFEVPSAYEIVARGKKILGSAQARRSTSVLQHGSLPLEGDLTRIVDCLAFDDAAERDALRDSLRDHAATVYDLTGRHVPQDEAVAAMMAGMTDALQIELVPGALTEEELAWTGDLLRGRYANDGWTMRA